MKAILLVLLATTHQLLASSCRIPPPCARITESSVVFAGMVTDLGLEEDSGRQVRFQVEEIFAGLAPGTKEVVVTGFGGWLIKGSTYLMDVERGDDGQVRLASCRLSDEIDSPYAADYLAYLRLLAKREAGTSLTVKVTNQYDALEGADVTIIGPRGVMKTRADKDGLAKFDGAVPGHYRVNVSMPHYSLGADMELDVSEGSCLSSMAGMKSHASVSGYVRNAQGVPQPALQLQIVSAPDDPSPRNRFSTESDEKGRFVFDSVSPGRYLLGSNLNGTVASRIPPTYYPGNSSSDAAIPVEVKPGEAVVNLIFLLPDFGAERDIHLCVVDHYGRPVASAQITHGFNAEEPDLAGLGYPLTTGETGCVVTHGFAKTTYAVQANSSQSQFSTTLVIRPGEKPVRQLLVLTKPDAEPQ